ncbi:MAG: hypothetical protein CMP75_02670 [Flavobacteriales bacterium]|nr:hypothetical protein [Flavobacteriales bacterium]|tara:strand:+ start:1015 stop:1281 length:267 start_codon:yes stop_codon:yes gene_type:complete
MHKTFTKEDLIRYLYGDMNLEERQELLSAIFEDNTLQAEFLALKEAKKCLNKGRLSPSNFAVNNIMSFAKALTVKPSKQLRMVDFVLN